MSIEEKLKDLEQQRQDIQQDNNKVLPVFFIIPFALIATLLFQVPAPGVIFAALSAAAIAIVFHFSRIGWPFQDLVSHLKSSLIEEYMASYHPDTPYKYQKEKKDVRAIIKSSKLIRANVYKEEDVLIGNHKGTTFYLSEIDLKRKTNNSSIRVFKGMMFRLSIPGKNFPFSLIQSKVGLLKRHLNNFNKNKEYGFHYATESESKFLKELEPLFPFIQHLIKQQGDIRIETHGEEILILLESSENFLDAPRPKLNDSFLDQDYYSNIVKQVNSFLYIIEAFSSKLSAAEVEEQLELKMLEVVKRVQA